MSSPNLGLLGNPFAQWILFFVVCFLLLAIARDIWKNGFSKVPVTLAVLALLIGAILVMGREILDALDRVYSMNQVLTEQLASTREAASFVTAEKSEDELITFLRSDTDQESKRLAFSLYARQSPERAQKVLETVIAAEGMEPLGQALSKDLVASTVRVAATQLEKPNVTIGSEYQLEAVSDLSTRPEFEKSFEILIQDRTLQLEQVSLKPRANELGLTVDQNARISAIK
ncbi:MAG: hypothetical protein KIT83_04915 [Bryobacterales bacterium]|nr:hypothetical protein [Bryobacterales bacterium]